jgi:hypothetical protein
LSREADNMTKCVDPERITAASAERPKIVHYACAVSKRMAWESRPRVIKHAFMP